MNNNVKLISVAAITLSGMGLIIGGSIVSSKKEKKRRELEKERKERKEQQEKAIKAKQEIFRIKTKEYFDEKTKDLSCVADAVSNVVRKFKFESSEIALLMHTGINMAPHYSTLKFKLLFEDTDFDLEKEIDNYKKNLDNEIENYLKFIDCLKDEAKCRCLIEQIKYKKQQDEEATKRNHELRLKELEKEIVERPFIIEKEKAIELAKIDQENKDRRNDTIKSIASDMTLLSK